MFVKNKGFNYYLGLPSIMPILFIFLLNLSFNAQAQNYQTNGVGEYLQFNASAMAIKLDLENQQSNPETILALDENKKLSFRMLVDMNPRIWSRMFLQNIAISSSMDGVNTYTSDLIAMTQVFKGDIRTGDLIELERLGENLAVLSFNGIDFAKYETPGFFDFVLASYIGDAPPSSELKEDLSANGEINQEMDALFYSFQYSRERVVEVASWGPEIEVDRPVSTVQVAQAQPQNRPGAPNNGGRGNTNNPGGRGNANNPGGAINASQLPALMDASQLPELTPESLLASASYQQSIMSKIYANLVYPPNAKANGVESSVRLAISISESGEVIEVNSLENQRTQQRPDFQRFLRAASNAITSSSPFEPLPDGIAERPYLADINVLFRIDY